MKSTPFQFLSLSAVSLLTMIACGTSPEDGEDTDAASGGMSGESGGASGETGGATNTGGTGDTGPSACGSGDTPFRLSAAVENNYTFTSTLLLPPQKVKPNVLLDFEWGAVTTSFLDQPLDPATDLTKIDVVLFPIPAEDVEEKINSNDPTVGDGAIGVSYYQIAGETTANLKDFTSFGSQVPVEEFEKVVNPEEHPPESSTYALMLSKSGTIGQGVQMIQTFQLDEASTETTVVMTDNSTTLNWDADLTSLTKTRIPAGQANVVIEWDNIPTTSFNGEFDATSISEVLIARYDLSIDQLKDQFLHIEDIGAEMYSGTVSTGTSVDLATLKDADGNTFPGISGEGIWLIGLLCPTCLNPTPWYVSVVEGCTE